MRSNRRGQAVDLLEQLSHTGDGVFVIDSRHRIILWNQAAEALLGYRAEDVLGKYCHEIIRARDNSGILVCSQWCSDFQLASKQQWPPHKNVCASTRDGREIWIDVSTLAVLSPRRELSSLVHIFRQNGEPHSFSTASVKFPVSTAEEEPDRGVIAQLAEEALSPPSLTRRERMVLLHLAQGFSTETTAELLFISPITVRNHIQNILQKLGAHSRLEAVALASRWQLFQPVESSRLNPSFTPIRRIRA